MSRILPYPGLTIALALFWVLLSHSVSPTTLAGAALIGLAAPWTLVPLKAARPRIKSLTATLRLTAIVLGGAQRSRTSGFVPISLDLTDRYGLALLAVIITSTPGTLWAQHDAAQGRLLLHVFDLVDESDWIKLVKNRYEPLLMEIFQ